MPREPKEFIKSYLDNNIDVVHAISFRSPMHALMAVPLFPEAFVYQTKRKKEPFIDIFSSSADKRNDENILSTDVNQNRMKAKH